MRSVTVVALVMLTAMSAPAQSNRKCAGPPVDSVTLATGMVYRDCEVDRPARPRGGEPRLDFRSTGATPRAGCYVAEFQFIVDTVGAVEMNSIRPKATNDRDLEDAVTPVLSTIRFEPALLNKHPVRQLVLYKRTVGVVVRVLSSSSGSAPPPAGASRPPRCR